MSKKVFVTSVQPEPEGPIFGRVMDPAAIQDLQDYAHGHISQVVKDLLMAGAPATQVAGFVATVAGGLNVSVATGTAVDALGISYESPAAASVVTMPAAHVSLPRIDLIIATLEVDAPAETEFVAFRQLRTQAELEAGTDPYVPTQYSQPTELHTRATISVKQGVANAAPVAPAVGAGEIALWQVHVSAGQTVLVGGDLTSVRVLMKSLYAVLQDVLVLQGQMAVLPETVQDIVGAFLSSPDSSLTVAYNDAGNVESIQLAAAYKALLDGATNLNTASKLVKRDANGNFNAGVSSLHAGQTSIGAGTGNARAGLTLEAPTGAMTAILELRPLTTGASIKFAVEEAIGQNTPLFYIFQGRGSNEELRFQFDFLGAAYHFGNVNIFAGAGGSGPGNLSVAGNLSKGSGTFLIDHPLDPDNKDLVHAFLEAPRHELIYRGRVQLVAGLAAVDIDDASGMDEGTFAALTQNIQFLPPYAETGWDKVRIQPGSFSGASFIIESENPGSTAWVSWAVIAERDDAFIRASDENDEDGHLIVERDKPAPDLSLLDPETHTVIGEEEGSEVVEQLVPVLIGTQGFRRHAAVTGEGTLPTKDVTVNTVTE